MCVIFATVQALQQQLFAQQFGQNANNGAERDQLRDLAEAMQKQLALLTRAVDELKDVDYPSYAFEEPLSSLVGNIGTLKLIMLNLTADTHTIYPADDSMLPH